MCKGRFELSTLFYKTLLSSMLGKFDEPIFMNWTGKKLREKALQTVMRHVHYEDESSCYACLGPINKMLNMLCYWVDDPNSKAFRMHIPRIYDYLWIAEDGMKMKVSIFQGKCGASAIWFICQCLVCMGKDLSARSRH